MAIQTLHDTGIDIPSKFDGGVYAVATTDCVIQGIGDEFTINHATDNLNITFNAGSQAIIGGAFFHITSLHTIELVANSTIYLCASIDLSRPDGDRGTFKLRTSSSMKSENINGSGIERDLLLYIITTNANGVTSVQDRRVIKERPSHSWNDLTDRPDINNGTLTIQKNGSNVATFGANSSTNVVANIGVPTKTSELTNNSGFINTSQLNSYFPAINTARRVISSTTAGQFTWTATEDVWVTKCWAANYGGIYINNVMLWGDSQGSYRHPDFFPLKKGQTIRIPIAQWQVDQGDRVGIEAYAVLR